MCRPLPTAADLDASRIAHAIVVAYLLAAYGIDASEPEAADRG